MSSRLHSIDSALHACNTHHATLAKLKLKSLNRQIQCNSEYLLVVCCEHC